MAEQTRHAGRSFIAHGDGTYTSQPHPPNYSDRGEPEGQMHHPSFGHMMAHFAKHHAQEGHMHIHEHEDGYTTHHVADGGKITGPVEHKTRAELIRHVRAMMDTDEDGQ